VFVLFFRSFENQERPDLPPFFSSLAVGNPLPSFLLPPPFSCRSKPLSPSLPPPSSPKSACIPQLFLHPRQFTERLLFLLSSPKTLPSASPPLQVSFPMPFFCSAASQLTAIQYSPLSSSRVRNMHVPPFPLLPAYFPCRSFPVFSTILLSFLFFFRAIRSPDRMLLVIFLLFLWQVAKCLSLLSRRTGTGTFSPPPYRRSWLFSFLPCPERHFRRRGAFFAVCAFLAKGFFFFL